MHSMISWSCFQAAFQSYGLSVLELLQLLFFVFILVYICLSHNMHFNDQIAVCIVMDSTRSDRKIRLILRPQIEKFYFEVLIFLHLLFAYFILPSIHFSIVGQHHKTSRCFCDVIVSSTCLDYSSSLLFYMLLNIFSVAVKQH